MINKANFYWEVMSFGLKNAKATYQRLMDRVFKDQIGRNVEVYMDDMIVKSDDPEQHAKDLEEIFSKLRKFDMHLAYSRSRVGNF